MENCVDKRQFSVTASDYQILEEIGQGVSATVYRARCIPFDEIVAIKSLDLEKCNSNLEEIRKEAATMSMINHPSVVRAYCSFVVDQHLWVVMPFLSGGSCLHIMKAAFPDGFEEPVIATILKETLKALEYLHRHGHIHRDVKAGNILVDSSGVVKLADFGVSACMFDTGDRQRTRQTFVGTPCWMAPEVMEQLHGYDFKADIWSFGITALELAHGHAPFSKYPPMKVLLMTLQNAPPGLDQERDKGRFSKAFKEMIAMCLVKDPAKRPAAEKLLKHAFFKHSKPPDYVARHILDGLPPLGERVKALKAKDQARLAQKKVPMEEQEAKSQNEYKRGVSSWNFNVEDLKAQAALLEDEEEDGSKGRSRTGSEHDQELLLPSSQSQAPSPASTPPLQPSSGTREGATTTTTEGNGGGSVKGKATPVPQPSQKTSNGPKYAPVPAGRKEPKHIGRFDVFEDDYGESPEYMQRHAERQRPLSGPLDPQRVVSGARTSQSDEPSNTGTRLQYERTQSDRYVGGELRHASAKSFSGALPSAGGSEDRPKGVPFVQKKGRFSVTSEDVDLEEDGPSTRVIGSSRAAAVSVSKSASAADVTMERRMSGGPSSASMPSISVSMQATSVPITAITPHLNNLLAQTAATQETIYMLMNSISPSDLCSTGRVGSKSNLLSRSGSLSYSEGGSELLIFDREQQLMHQVVELQSKLATVTEEMQNLKLRNVQLERQLNAIYNEEEERRIQLEESRKEGGN